MMRRAIDTTTLYALRAALVSALRIVEDALGLADEQRVLRPPRRKQGETRST